MMKAGSRLLRQPKFSAASINKNVTSMSYDVRGRVVIEALALQKQLQAEQLAGSLADPPSHDFTDVTFCNIGNPQQLGQRPLTYVRQILSLFANPQLVRSGEYENSTTYKRDVTDRAISMLSHTTECNGAYTHSQGFEFVRDNICSFLEARDGHAAHAENIFMTDGASQGVKLFLNLLISGGNDGIMIPIPQYPLYSATITNLGGRQVDYYLEEEQGWSLDVAHLKRQVDEARAEGTNVRAICVINPGNPTGQVLPYSNVEEIIKFAHAEELIILADEVYQANVYDAAEPWVSFKQVLMDLGEDYDDVGLVSFHSVSKGLLGECGQRGGYMEVLNFDPSVMAEVYKLATVNLCPNLAGQLIVDLMVKPPSPGQPSYPLYEKETSAIFASLGYRAKRLTEALNQLPGVSCQPVQGAMYVFPRIDLPQNAIEEADRQGIQPDMLYCLEALHGCGVVMVPGSGFGQKAGTYHFRMSFLPKEDIMEDVCTRIARFHNAFMAKYA